MNCIKCGREFDGDQAFCPHCLDQMAKNPVKPGVVINLPSRPDTSQKKPISRKRVRTPEEQILRLKRINKRLIISLCLMTLLVTMLTNCMVKPNFIACNKLDRGSLAVRLTTRLYHAPRFVWTVKTADEWQEAQARGEYPIFEQIRPR